MRLRVPPPELREFRVLVLHHSITRDGALPGDDTFRATGLAAQLRPLLIEPQTLAAVESALFDLGVKVALCGHIHSPKLSIILASHNGHRLDVLEARCGTTTQFVPFEYFSPNTLLVHEIDDVDGNTVWQSSVYVLGRDDRFRLATGGTVSTKLVVA